jgi:hypothetical protein
MMIEAVEGNEREDRQERTVGPVGVASEVIAVPPGIVGPFVVGPWGDRGIISRRFRIDAATSVARRHPQDGDAATSRRPGDLDAKHNVSADRIRDEHLVVMDISLVGQKLDERIANLVQFGLGHDSLIVDRDD